MLKRVWIVLVKVFGENVTIIELKQKYRIKKKNPITSSLIFPGFLRFNEKCKKKSKNYLLYTKWAKCLPETNPDDVDDWSEISGQKVDDRRGRGRK